MKDTYIVGRNPVIEALKNYDNIEKIFMLKGDLSGSINKIIGLAKSKNIVIQEVDKNKLDELTEDGRHQGVAALITGFEYSTVDDMFEKAKKEGKDPFIIILDEIKDPHNLGAIIRTAECAGAHGVIIPERRAAGVNQTVYSSSVGAVEYMHVAQVTNISSTITDLKERGLWIYGGDMDGENYYYDTNLTGPVGIVIGNEGKGISKKIKEKCDVLVKIPLFGEVSSLNASTSAAVLIYEVIRQNAKKG